jgi:hypothetical protein
MNLLPKRLFPENKIMAISRRSFIEPGACSKKPMGWDSSVLTVFSAGEFERTSERSV